jgi:hypothetical protein
LRASHRATDPELSLPHRPWHRHDRIQPLVPGETVELDGEIWPTSVVVPGGYRVALTVLGRDFELPGDGPWPKLYGEEMKGNGIFLHTDPQDRPAEVFTGTTTVVSDAAHGSYFCCRSLDPKMVEHPPGPVQFGLFGTPLHDDLDRVHELTRAAEACGFDYMSIQDQPYESTFLDSLALTGVLIGRTGRLRFVSNVANLPLLTQTDHSR